MKRADSCFKWNIVATLTNGNEVELVEWSGDIHDIGIALEKLGVTVSRNILYQMKKVKDREYLAKPLRAPEIAPSYQEQLGVDGEHVAEWHIKIESPGENQKTYNQSTQQKRAHIRQDFLIVQ